MSPGYSLGTSERRTYGVTATLVDTHTGHVRTEVFRGNMNVGEATQACAAFCDALGPTWRVRTLSTPISILSDLRNNRNQRPVGYHTEHALLSRIGRPDLIEGHSKYLGLTTGAARARRRKA